jgi:thiamine biosynthesis protein ThiS
MAERIKVIINGCEENIPRDSSILYLLEMFGENRHHLIVELNDFFVPPSQYGSRCVSEGDMVEFINPNLGG